MANDDWGGAQCATSSSHGGLKASSLRYMALVLFCVSDLPGDRDPGSCSRTRSWSGIAVVAGEEWTGPSSVFNNEDGPSCRCGERGCMCDLSAAGDALGPTMVSLGYDTCVDDGLCEGCLGAEAFAAYCLPTSQRQRVVCAACQSPDPPLPFCLPGFRIFWQANDTQRLALQALNETVRVGTNAGLFYRSCGAGSAVKNSLRGGAAGSGNRGAPKAPAAPDKADEKPAPPAAQAVHRPGAPASQDESEQLLCFLALNIVVFLVSGYSLRCQQRKQLEQTMQTLYSHVGEHAPNGVGPSSNSPVGSSAGASSHLAASRGDSSSRQSKPSPGIAKDKRQSGGALGAEPETLGRTISAAAARAGNALELAVMGEANAGSRAKMK